MKAPACLSLSGRTLPLIIGFGYRFGDDLSAYRVVFGSPY